MLRKFSLDVLNRDKYKEVLMKNSHKVTGPVLQPECKACTRFAILKSPCPKENCIFRCKESKPTCFL